MLFHRAESPEGAPTFQVAIPESFERKIVPFAKPAVHRLLRLEELNDLYSCVADAGAEGDIWQRILRSLNVAYQVSPKDLANIPAHGPLVVVANHPYGGIEGIILAALLRSVRDDAKVLANSLLYSFPRLRELLIPVDPFGGKSAAACNIRGLKSAIHWVAKGGVLIIFPAGKWRTSMFTKLPLPIRHGTSVSERSSVRLPQQHCRSSSRAIMALCSRCSEWSTRCCEP
jgi:putative hemolysin